jgi:hypothetical protein
MLFRRFLSMTQRAPSALQPFFAKTCPNRGRLPVSHHRTYHTTQISRDVPTSAGMKLRDCSRNGPYPTPDIASILRQWAVLQRLGDR